MLNSQFLKICEIVTFDFGYQLINKKKREKVKNEIQKKFPEIKVGEEDFNPIIYDCEFIRINENKKPIVMTGIIRRKNIKNIIYDYKKELSENGRNNFYNFETFCDFNNINFRIVLDSYGIGTLRTEFDLIQNNSINVVNIIKLIIDAGKFVDEYLFPNYFKNKISESLSSLFKKNGEIILKGHHTYSFVATNNKQVFRKSQLYGIVWKDENYKDVRDELIEKIVNDIAMEPRDNFIISQPTAFIRFRNLEFKSPYFQNHIKVLEILRRQHHLLKKFDFQLTEVIEKKKKSNLSSIINEVIQIQDNIFLLSEFYKNIKTFAMQEYMYIFERGNDVFRINDLYESLKSKIDWSYNIVNNLIQEQRNNLIFILEIVGFPFLYTINWRPFLVKFLKSIKFYPFIIYICDFLGFILIAWLVYQNIMKFSQFKRKILRKI